MLTHDNLVVNLLQCGAPEADFWEDEVVISPLPFFHIYAFMVSVQVCAQRGVPLITMPRFDLDVFCELVQVRLHACSMFILSRHCRLYLAHVKCVLLCCCRSTRCSDNPRNEGYGNDS